MTTLIRRDAGGTREWQEVASEPEAEEETPRPTSRVVRFEVPDGFMATISLVPYTETPTVPEMEGWTSAAAQTRIDAADAEVIMGDPA